MKLLLIKIKGWIGFGSANGNGHVEPVIEPDPDNPVIDTQTAYVQCKAASARMREAADETDMEMNDKLNA